MTQLPTPIQEEIEKEFGLVAMADFAYNKDNPKYNGTGEPPSMVYEMAEKAWKLWHLKEFITQVYLAGQDSERERIQAKPGCEMPAQPTPEVKAPDITQLIIEDRHDNPMPIASHESLMKVAIKLNEVIRRINTLTNDSGCCECAEREAINRTVADILAKLTKEE